MAVPRRNAKAVLRNTLRRYGLGGLTDWWWDRRQSGWSDQELWLAIRDTRVYKQRFKGLEEARAAGHPVNEAAYVEFEQNVYAMGRGMEIPRAMLAGLIPKWIAGGTSAVEIQERLDQDLAAIDRYVAGNPDVQAQLAAAEQLYGARPTRGDLLAMALDPELGQREAVRRLQAVRAAATAQTTGFGPLSREEAEGLTGYGLTADEEQEGFGELVEAAELFQPLDEGEDVIDRQTQFGATFGGNAAARRRIAQRQRRRGAVFEEGGGWAAGKEGFAGLGSAST